MNLLSLFILHVSILFVRLFEVQAYHYISYVSYFILHYSIFSFFEYVLLYIVLTLDVILLSYVFSCDMKLFVFV